MMNSKSMGFFSTIGLIIFFTSLFPGNLMAVNIEGSKAYHNNFRFTQTSSSSYQDNYDVLYYNIDLKIKHTATEEEGIIRGAVGFEARIEEDNVSEIQINLADTMTVISVYNESGQLDFNHSDDLITVTLDRTYSKDEIISVTTTYKGWPQPGYEDRGLNVMIDKESTQGQLVISTVSLPECARLWWPCKDQVNDKADSFDIAIQVDKEFFCVSNGRLDTTISIGDTAHTFYYEVRHPMTTYSFAMAISNYSIWEHEWIYNDDNGDLDTMPIFHYVYKTYNNTVLELEWEKTSDVLTLLSDWFGLYPFADEKYGHVNFQFSLGMEHQTISFMSGESLIVFENLKYLVHELAHQWWGNMITCKSWSDAWIQEGLATYAEALYYENDYEHNPREGWKKYHKHMNEKRCERIDRSIYVEDETDFDAIYEEKVVYYKGAWVMHMLRRKLGDDLFRACLKALYNSEYQYGSITSEQFIYTFDSTANADLESNNDSDDTTKVDLVKFFDQWVYGVGFPIYEYSYWQGPADPNDGSINIFLYVEQVQETDPEVFEMPVDFVFDYYKNDTLQSDTVTLEVDSTINRFVVKVSGDSIKTVKLDPENWVLQKNNNIDWRMRFVTLDGFEIPDVALDTGVIGLEYVDTIYTSNGFGNATISHIGGSLPFGWVINDSGIISGTCIEEGKYDFIVTATEIDTVNPLLVDALVDTASLSLTIIPVPEKYHLYQNYPNPFNNGTIISFDLPKSGNVTIEIYNILGQKVTTLIDGYYMADHKYIINWQGKNNFGSDVASGIYLYRLQSGDYTSTRKMLLLK